MSLNISKKVITFWNTYKIGLPEICVLLFMLSIIIIDAQSLPKYFIFISIIYLPFKYYELKTLRGAK